MDSGKSIQLLIKHHSLRQKGKKSLVFKPAIHTRDGDCVKSRAMEETVPALMVDKDSVDEMYDMVKRVRPYCVFVDEVQFMPEHQIDELAKIVDLLHIPVIVYGLLTDFQTNLFTGSRRLLEIGAKVEVLESDCRDCSNPAIYNMRLYKGVPVFDGEQVLVGKHESYKPVCRSCYNKEKAKSLSTSQSQVV